MCAHVRFFGAVVLMLMAGVVGAVPSWVKEARVGNADLYNSMSDAEIGASLSNLKDQNVSVLEIDTKLSLYLSDSAFEEEVAFIDKAARKGHALGLKSVIYYPSLEVITPQGRISDHSMFRDHPDWVQYGISGAPNVFYGTQEVWLDSDDESAWMSPNSPYKDYYLDRIRQLAATAVDGIWIDVPIYLETGTAWAGMGSAALEDFHQWSVQQDLNDGAGYTLKGDGQTAPDFSNPAFRAWVKWRHENLADFLEAIRVAAQSVNPEMVIIVENFPFDYMDATKAGLDATVRRSQENMIHVWETDSVSNTTAMRWSSFEDFENKIAMLKWGKSIEEDNPSWSFSYGDQPIDAGLVMSAVVASGNAPFEAKTPDMTQTVGADFRRNWFGFIDEHSDVLLKTERKHRVGIWYSGATRDFQDFPEGGEYGMFANTDNPLNVPDWWSTDNADSVIHKPHLGDYRGFSSAMIQLQIPYKVVTSANASAESLAALDVLILPSVAALSDSSAETIRNYVRNGGTVFAAGNQPGILDEWGASRTLSNVTNLFDFSEGQLPRVNQFGKGLAIYRPDIIARHIFGEARDANDAADTLSAIEQLIRIHVTEDVAVDDPQGLYIDVAQPDNSQHYLYVVNYSGLKKPLVPNPKTISLYYRPPAGFKVSSAQASTPDANGESGYLTVKNMGGGQYQIDITVDQFALIALSLAPDSTGSSVLYNKPEFQNPAHEEAAESGLAFVLNQMRNASLPVPHNYGVFTNLRDNNSSTEIYTHGHHVTAEHMGLLLRTSACMKDETAFAQAYEYVNTVMRSPLYHVPNWAIDKNNQRPFIEFNWDYQDWLNANAPLDDLRIIRGLIDGAQKLSHPDAEALAQELLTGLYWTTVTDRDRDTQVDYPNYLGGILGFAWDWAEENDNSRSPAAIASGLGWLTDGLIPVDYQDLGTIALASQRDFRWGGVLRSATKLLLDSEIDQRGLFYNGLEQGGRFTGDFENQGSAQGEHLKTIQVLWTAIHLARVGQQDKIQLNSNTQARALASARRSLNFFKAFYEQNNRIPEYLTFSGKDVPDCGNTANCLKRGVDNLFFGEVRIYAQAARLALLLDEPSFAQQLINEKLLTDRIADPADPRYGMIGVSTAANNDAEAWNVLESVFTLCLFGQADTRDLPPAEETPPSGSTPDESAEYETKSTDIITGKHDWGTLQSLSKDDADTYDIDSALVNNSHVVVWEASTQLSNRDDAEQLLITYAGHYSVAGVIQTLSLYNFRTNAWEEKDTRQVGNETDAVITLQINPPLSDYISNQGEARLRIKGIHNTQAFQVWANRIRWTLKASTQVNRAPVASSMSLSTARDASLSVSLEASDPDGDALTFTIINPPAHGRLDGTAPELIYVPNTGFSGPDRFSFKVSDGKMDSALATINLNVTPTDTTNSDMPSNPVSNIVLDGVLTDWAALKSFGKDADDITGSLNRIDWREAWLAHDNDHFYWAFRNEGNISLSWGYSLYLDTDNSINTGYSDGLAIGADYLVQGEYLYQYSGDGISWAWQFVSKLSAVSQGNTAEIQIPRSIQGQSETIKLIMIGDNKAYEGGNQVDFYPDGIYMPSSAARTLRYRVSALNEPPPISTEKVIEIDGQFADWQSRFSFGQDVGDVSGAVNLIDWQEAWAADDADHYYFAYRNAQPITLNWGYSLYIDADQNPNTGYQGDLAIGAEFLIQGAHLHVYSGTGAGDWQWNYLGSVAHAVSGKQLEMAVPKSLLKTSSPNQSSPNQRQPLHLVFLGDNRAHPGGTVLDAYPDRALSSSAARDNRYFRY